MTEINVSAHTPYHSQVNNNLYPLSTCNTTSAIMWMLDCGAPFIVPDGVQPEDHLTQITETPEAYDYMLKAAPWAYQGTKALTPPRQVHVCLAWAINRLAGREVVHFRENATFQDLVAELARGKAALMSGNFTPPGHVVCLVGVRTRQERTALDIAARVRIDQIEGWIVDDPYGNYWTNYRDHRGNDIYFSFDELERLTREPCRNRKWAHVYVG